MQVGPRDGLQNEKTLVPTDVKVDFISRLAGAGRSQPNQCPYLPPPARGGVVVQNTAAARNVVSKGRGVMGKFRTMRTNALAALPD